MKLKRALIGTALALATVAPAAVEATPASALYSPINFRWTAGCATGKPCYYSTLTADRGTFNGSYTIFRAVISTTCGQKFGPWKNVASGTTSSTATAPLGCYATARGWQTG